MPKQKVAKHSRNASLEAKKSKSETATPVAAATPNEPINENLLEIARLLLEAALDILAKRRATESATTRPDADASTPTETEALQ